MQALVTAEGHSAVVQERPIPTLSRNGDILVKVEAVTLNPTDWKHVKLLSEPGSIVGCDFAGTVVKVYGDTGSVKENDRVAGFVHGGKYNDIGSFAQFVKTDAALTVKVPKDIGLERAASIGVGGYTAAQALFQRLDLELPSREATNLPSVGPGATQILIWSGSTSVGQWAIQLARAAGYYVITTASPSNHQLLREMGAAEVYSYKDEGVPEKISKEHPNLNVALDCISEHGTQSLCVRSLGTKRPGKVVVLLKPEREARTLRDDVMIVHTLAYTCLGNPFSYGAAQFTEEQVQADRKFMLKFTDGERGIFHHLLQHKLITGNRIKSCKGGLHEISEGLAILEQGKVSAEKLAYSL